MFPAIEFAVRAHAGQFRKGTRTPYVVHPIAVARILLELGCLDEVVAAGALHDTVEDTPTRLETIRETFGAEVARLVAGASESDKSKPWADRKQEAIARIATADPDVLLVECADKLDNVREIGRDLERHGPALWARFNAPEGEQRRYYRALADAFVARSLGEPSATLFAAFREEVDRVFPPTEGGGPA